MHVGLLSGQVFSPFGEHRVAGSHGGGGITSGINVLGGSPTSTMAWAVGIGGVWWDLRLASLLTHLFISLFSCFSATNFVVNEGA